MARGRRTQYTGAAYHVWIRGNRRETVFIDERDRLWFLDRLEGVLAEAGTTLFAFCLMGNHAHLVLQADGLPLSRVMQRLLTGYAMWFNRRHAASGHVFQGRYGSRDLHGDEDFLTVLRYVHRNPVAAGLVGDPADWPWSSHHAYLAVDPPPFLRAGILRTRAILSDDVPRAIAAYQRLVAADEDTPEVEAGPPRVAPASRPSPTSPFGASPGPRRVPLAELLGWVAAEWREPADRIRGRSRQRQFAIPRHALVFMGVERAGWSRTEVAEFLSRPAGWLRWALKRVRQDALLVQRAGGLFDARASIAPAAARAICKRGAGALV